MRTGCTLNGSFGDTIPVWNIVGYSGIQKGTVGTVGYNVGDTMSVWGRTTSIPCMHSPTTKERFFDCRRIKLKRDQSKQNRAHRGCGWIKMSSQTFDQLSSLSSQLPFVGMEQCYKAGWDALQVFSSTPPLQLSGSFLNNQKYFT